MYALCIIRYRRPLEQVMAVVDEHRAYLRDLKKQRILLASGPFDPRLGGAILVRVDGADPNAALDRIRDADPFYVKGIVQYELLPWNVVIGAEDLDKI
jgi:uncharacterized protein YciI